MPFWARKKDEADPVAGDAAVLSLEPVEERRTGFIDRIDRRLIVGWCWNPLDPGQSLAVEAVGSNDVRVVAIACLFRQDVKEASCGTGFYGFEIALDRLAGADSVTIRFADSHEPITPEPIALDPVRSLLTSDLPDAFARRTGELCLEIVLRHARLRKGLWSSTIDDTPCDPRLLAVVAPGKDPEGLVTRFVAQECARVVRDAYDVEMLGTLQDRIGVLLWYLDRYALSRSFEARVPLTTGQVAFLNTPVPLGGGDAAITVALHNFVLRDRPSHANLADSDLCAQAIYWWCIDKAPLLRLEAALVTPAQVEFLRRGSDAGGAMPCNRFMVGWYDAHGELHGLDLDLPRDRAALLVHLVLASFLRPDLLRFLPHETLRLLLRPGDGGRMTLDTILERFATAASFSGAAVGTDLSLREMGNDLLAAAGTRLAPSRQPRHPSTPVPLPPPEPGVGLIGPIRMSSGLGRATRLSLATLAQAEAVPPTALAFDLENPGPGGTAFAHAAFDASREITLLHLNAEAVPLAYAYGPRALLAGSYTIGFFFWELNEIPACHRLGLDLVDEVWVASEYDREIYARATTKPVIRVGMAAPRLPDAPPAAREDYGLESDSFVFLASFDSLSFVARKNPQGVVEAFARAFPLGSEPVRLVLKTQNRGLVSDGWQLRAWARIDRLVAADPRILVVDETLAADEIVALTRACDAYVSLHRSEGWGFGLVEAMQLGLPVICTGYSGNADFCTHETAFLVDYDLIPVAADEYIYVPRGSVWADPCLDSAAAHMRRVVEDRAGAAAKADAARAYVARELSLEATARRYAERLAAIRGCSHGKTTV